MVAMNFPFLRWSGIAFFLVLLLALIVIPVSAEIQRPLQGDLVESGSVIDLTGTMGWAEKMAYYGYSGDLESDPLYVVEFPNTKKEYYAFYLDPKIFNSRLGPWFQYYGNDTGSEHGNLLMFRVVKKLPAVNVTNVTANVTPVPTILAEYQLIQPKPFSTNYQIAYGDPFFVLVNDKYMPARLWVFGRIDGIYNKSYPTSRVTLTSEELQNLEVGEYTIIVQNPGKNAIFEVGYNKIVTDARTTEELTSPWAAVKSVNVYGYQPRMVLPLFIEMVKNTDDPVTQYQIEITHPVIDITSIDETYSGGKDVLDIRGYTNVAKDTELTVVMDEDRQIALSHNATEIIVKVQEDKPNLWRYFQAIIPIDYSTIPVGQHEITVTAPQGATQTVPFYVYDLPAGQEVPNETVKYVAGDLFRPTPTPIVVTQIVTQVVTQIVTVPVTPSTETVYAQQKKASDENFWYWITTGLEVLVVGVVLFFGGRYLIRVVKRARLR